MALNLASLAVKVPLSWALIYGAGPLPELGGPGAGLASSVVAWLVLAAVAVRLRWGARYRRFAIFGGSFAPDWPRLREITVLGVPIGLTFLVDVTAYTFMALFLARLGATVSGAHQIVANLGAVVFMVPLSIGAATQILIGRSLGARAPAKARVIAWEGMRLGLVVAVGVSLLLLVARGAIVALYTSDPAVSALALALLPILAAYHLGDAVQGVATQALRGYHRTALPLAMFIVVMWGIGLGGGYALAFHGFGIAGLGGDPLGASGFWLAAALSVTLLAALLCAYLARVARRER
jgi:MATE family multidrug resistance protein